MSPQSPCTRPKPSSCPRLPKGSARRSGTCLATSPSPERTKTTSTWSVPRREARRSPGGRRWARAFDVPWRPPSEQDEDGRAACGLLHVRHRLPRQLHPHHRRRVTLGRPGKISQAVRYRRASLHLLRHVREACPCDAIELTPFYEVTGMSRQELIFDKTKLLEVYDQTIEEKPM